MRVNAYADSYNQFHNILRLFNVKRWAIITFKHGIYTLPHELPNDIRRRLLGNEEISGKYLNFTVPSSSAKMKVFPILAETS